MELSVEKGKKILCVTVFGYGITALLLYSAYDYMPSGMATVIHFGIGFCVAWQSDIPTKT